jgi:hypothetical protein
VLVHRRTRVRATVVASAVALVLGSATGLAATAHATGRPAAAPVGATAATAKAKPKKPVRGPFAGLTAAQIRSRSVLAMKYGKTLHVVGTVVKGGVTYGIDLRVGPDANGTLSWAGGGSMTVRRVGPRLWLRPDDAYYVAHKHPELVAQRHATWVEIVPADPDYKDIFTLTRLDTWTKLVGAVPVSGRKPGATFAGTPTVALTGKTGPKGPVLYVAAKGPSFPLYVASVDKKDHLALQQWSVPFTVAEPTPAHVLPELPDAVVDVPADPVDSAAAFATIWPA